MVKVPTRIPRTPWPANFPQVEIHGELKRRDSHPAYLAAKSGDAESAQRLVEDLLSPEETSRIGQLIGGVPVRLLAVTADEVAGFNAIPDAMAQALAAQLGLEVSAGTVMQANKVGHTRAKGWHRLVTPAIFTGEIISGAAYFLVDDHVGFGGTLANLHGYVRERGAYVVGMTALTETRDARQIALRHETLDMLWGQHGSDLDSFWRQLFGHGIECLTDIEAGYLCRAESVAAIEDRMAEAAESARGRGLSPVGLAHG